MKVQMKASIRLFILSAIALILFVTPLKAQMVKERIFPESTGSRAQIASTSVQVRSYPSKYSDVIQTVDKQEIYILGSNADWYRVSIHGKQGWVAKNFVNIREKAFIPYSKVLGEEVVAYGKQFIGTPYVWGGNDLKRGVDCSGLTQKVFEGFDINLSRISYMQVANGRRISRYELRPGDLVFFDTSGINRGNISHVGIYAGEGMFLHADCTKGVTLSSLSNKYYLRNYVTSSRVLMDA